MTMKNIIFALGADDSYMFNAPKAWRRSNLPEALENLFEQDLISDVKWAAFGPTKDSYVFVYIKKRNGLISVIYGTEIPKELSDWLADKSEDVILDNHLKVVLGPSNSFFAWNTDSIRWHNIPPGLQKTIQSWLGPTGWSKGPPRVVALGAKASYFALSEYGAWACSVPKDNENLSDEFNEYYKKDSGYDLSSIEYVSFSASNPQYFVIIHGNTLVRYKIPGPVEDLYVVAESFAKVEILSYYKNQREHAQNIKDAKIQVELDAKAKALHEELERHYQSWLTKCSASFQDGTNRLTIFPHMPLPACTCDLHSCKIRKNLTGLLACRHDVEKLLRIDASYSSTWLRNESLKWHPDRFGMRCNPLEKQVLLKQATEMFAIFRELIEAED